MLLDHITLYVAQSSFRDVANRLDTWGNIHYGITMFSQQMGAIDSRA